MKIDLKIVFTFFIFVFSITKTVAQTPALDSLKLALKNSTHDTTRCKILNLLIATASDEEWPGFNLQLEKIAEQNLSSRTTQHPLYKFYLLYKLRSKLKERLKRKPKKTLE